MQRNYDEALKRVLAHEGGYTNHPSDPGGPTNWGITIYDARKYWKSGATAEDVKAMPLSVAKAIYRSKYWDAQNCDDLPDGVDYAVFDYGVNSGIGRSAKVLQRLVGVTVDGKIGQATLAAAAAMSDERLVAMICDERLAFLKRLKTWPVFGKGWGRRVAEVRQVGTAMARQPEIVGSIARGAAAAGKGEVPLPGPIKTAAENKGTSGAVVAAGGAGAGVSFWDWIGAHPVSTAVIVVAAIVAATLAVHAFRAWHKSQQEEPTPGYGAAG